MGDIYGEHVAYVSCADIIGIKHRHNVVRDTLSTSVLCEVFRLVKKLI